MKAGTDMNAADVMTHTVFSVDPDRPVQDVAKLMQSRQISALPVVEPGGRLIGVISEGDLMRRAELDTEAQRSWWLRTLAGDDELAGQYVKCRGRKARDVMTRDPVTVTEGTPIAEIVRLLESHRIKRVPVLRGKQVVGIVSRANLLRAFASKAVEEPPDVSDDDRTIRDRLLKELKRQPWWRGDDGDIIVTNRVVHLWGAVETREVRDALRVAAEGVPGVKAVKNHVVVERPMILFAS